MAGDKGDVISREDLLRMAVDIVAAYVSRNQVDSAQIPEVIGAVVATLGRVGGSPAEGGAAAARPSVPIRRSVTDDYIVCLEDGKRLKMLKRHLRTTHGMTLEDYRAKWKLPPDYPMVAPKYARQRSAFAKKIGLGRKRVARRRRPRRR